MSPIDDEESTDYFAYDLNYIKSEIDIVNSKLAYLNLSIEDNYYDGVSIILNDSRELFDEMNQKWKFDGTIEKEFIDMFRNELADDYNIVFEFIKNKIENGELEMNSESRVCSWSMESAISVDDSISKLNEAKEHFEKMLNSIQLDVNKIKNLNITISNNKGGVLKTTVATNLACQLVVEWYKVALFDLDNQCNISTSFMTISDKQKSKKNIMDLLLGDSFKNCVDININNQIQPNILFHNNNSKGQLLFIHGSKIYI